MNLWIAVTDNDWFRFLRSQSHLDEVNFWQPGASGTFRRLQSGEPFLFKLHSPENYIVGGGFFGHFSRLRATLAWEAFGVKNGTRTFEEMRARIGKYRREPLDSREDPSIGCVILTQSFFFFDEIDWASTPDDFSLNIVQGKTYDTLKEPGRSLWLRVQSVLRVAQPAEVGESQQRMYGEPILVMARLGQGSFRVVITDTYERHCAVTGEKALPTLEAAHIRPVASGGLHRIDNGLLLRSDVHRLFDRGYVTVTPDYRVRVSHRLRDDFDNGEPYYPLDPAGDLAAQGFAGASASRVPGVALRHAVSRLRA
ncbi:MAG TPA: HNH endonuclease [Thermoanaerobaculia bacterium]|nr:HNH endonuclease [Thermoanaerobaculia bacterium]